MKKTLLLCTIIVVLFNACKKDNNNDDVLSYYLVSHSFEGPNSGTGGSTFEYDGNNRLVAENVVAPVGQGTTASYRLTYQYGPDGKISSAWRDNVREREYTRDAQGRLTLISYFSPAGNLATTQQYQYFSDKHTVSQFVSGTQTNTSTYFYTTDGKNYTRLELHDQQNQLQYAVDLTVMPQKNPYKLVLDFFGVPAAENTLVASHQDMQVLQTVGEYATLTKAFENGVLYRTDTFELIMQ